MESETELLTVQEFAEIAGVSVQSIYKRLNNSLNPYFQLVEWRKMLKRSALFEVYGVEVEQPIKPFVKPIHLPIQPELNENKEQSEVLFLRKQVEELQRELERERQHNWEKDRQLLDTLSKLAESQAALVAGQTAEKQKQLAETIIEGAQRMDGGADRAEPEPQQPQPEPPRSWWSWFWEK